ncbi:hypothetical protein D3C84_993680 [compost metagenome]
MQVQFGLGQRGDPVVHDEVSLSGVVAGEFNPATLGVVGWVELAIPIEFARLPMGMLRSTYAARPILRSVPGDG